MQSTGNIIIHIIILVLFIYYYYEWNAKFNQPAAFCDLIDHITYRSDIWWTLCLW